MASSPSAGWANRLQLLRQRGPLCGAALSEHLGHGGSSLLGELGDLRLYGDTILEWKPTFSAPQASYQDEEKKHDL